METKISLVSKYYDWNDKEIDTSQFICMECGSLCVINQDMMVLCPRCLDMQLSQESLLT